LKEFGAAGPPVPIEEVLRYYGLTLARERRASSWSGMLRGDRVVVNQEHSEGRQRFTAAHELGHVRLGHLCAGLAGLEPLDEVERLATAEWTAILGRADAARIRCQEVEANAFAAELLAPRAWVRHSYRQVRDPDRLADVFGLSRQAMWLACLQAGCILPARRRLR
jgi:hypothetical protein